MSSLWGMLLAFLTGTVKDWLADRREVNKVMAVARAEAISKGIPGWSDEFALLVLSGPIIGAFVPGLQPLVKDGFAFLDGLPDWYVGLYVTVVLSVFGLDKILKVRGGGGN